MLNCVMICLVFLSLIYGTHTKIFDAKNVIYAVNTVARDYRNAKLADDRFSSNVDKLSAKINDISKILSVKLSVKEDDSEGWKIIEQDLYSGIVLLLNSCETKNVKGYLLGSFKVSSALVAVTGIQGALDAAILDAVGQLFDTFGSVFEGRNPTKYAFQEFQDVGMDLDFKEAKFYFENILNPVVLNTDSDRLIKQPFERIEKDRKCCQYNEDEMIEILRLHQKPLHLYSKVSSLLLTFCSNEVNKRTNGFGLNRCTTVLKQYCEISKTHQAFLLRVLASIKRSNVTDNMIFVHKLLFHVKSLFKRDTKTLGFLFNPMKSYHNTKVLFSVHVNRTEFKDVLDHTEVLHKKFNLYSSDSIVLCRQTELRGLCHEMESTIENKKDVKSWKFKQINEWWTEAHSMFIPPHIKVEFMTSDIDIARNRPHSYHGPFKGLAVYSSDEAFDLRNIRITVESKFKEDPQTRICTANGWCDTFSDDTKSFRSIHGIDMSQSLIKSIEIPDGTLLKLLTADGSIIPLIGPFNIADMDRCKVWSWSQIVQIKKVLTGNSVTKSDVLYEANISSDEVRADEDVSKGSEIQVLTKVKRITDVEYTNEERADMLVVVCTRPYLKGFCVQYDSDYVAKGTFSTFQQVFKTECKLGMQSMMIPGGIKVIGYQKIDGKYNAFGPYTGPIVIDKLENEAEYQIEVTNMFKSSKSLSSVIKPKYRTNYF